MKMALIIALLTDSLDMKFDIDVSARQRYIITKRYRQHSPMVGKVKYKGRTKNNNPKTTVWLVAL